VKLFDVFCFVKFCSRLFAPEPFNLDLSSEGVLSDIKVALLHISTYTTFVAFVFFKLPLFEIVVHYFCQGFSFFLTHLGFGGFNVIWESKQGSSSFSVCDVLRWNVVV